MIIIGICDGEQAVRSLIAGFVERCRTELGEEIKLLSYSTGEKLCKNYLLDLDLLFLEIPLRKISGLKLAENIRKYDKRVRIVFLTTVLSYVLEAFEAGASNYLLKPLSYEKFLKELNAVLEERQGSEGRYFLEQNRQGLYKIYFRDIRYIETSKKSVLIHTGREDILSSRTLKELEQLFFGTSLIRCHAAFIVNLRYFKKLEGSLLALLDDVQIPVSRNRKKAVLSGIRQFYGEKEDKNIV